MLNNKVYAIQYFLFSMDKLVLQNCFLKVWSAKNLKTAHDRNG